MSPDTSIISTGPGITEFEKLIYNSFLATSKKVKNQPFKFRQDFSKFDPTKYVYLKKLASFFNRHNHIHISNFFVAPYEVYNKEEYYDLQFYLSRKALLCYTNYMRNKQMQDPDSDDCIEQAKKCLKFIFTYCKDNNLTLDKYKTYVAQGSMPMLLVHLKEHRINFYTLHALDTERTIKSIETDMLNFYFSDFWNIYKTTRNKFVASTRLKTVLRQGLEILQTKLLTS